MKLDKESPGLKVESLTLWVEDFQLSANFYVNAGERCVLWGKSGSGKTTLLRVIAGLETVSHEVTGKIHLGSQDITQLPPQRRGIGFVFQDQVLFPNLNVLDNAAFGLKVRGVSRDERNEQARVWLARLGLQSKMHAAVESLSLGERQRVAFVRALIWKPQLLLLDEPFSSLDPELRKLMRKELLDLHQILPVPLVLVTHDEADVEAIATVSLEVVCNADASLRAVSREKHRPVDLH
jgi:ABC-type Fe3+/spermidine/putrescine transport system ATPase subunit